MKGAFDPPSPLSVYKVGHYPCTLLDTSPAFENVPGVFPPVASATTPSTVV